MQFERLSEGGLARATSMGDCWFPPAPRLQAVTPEDLSAPEPMESSSWPLNQSWPPPL